jgi:hypothetical protein
MRHRILLRSLPRPHIISSLRSGQIPLAIHGKSPEYKMGNKMPNETFPAENACRAPRRGRFHFLLLPGWYPDSSLNIGVDRRFYPKGRKYG